MSTVNGENLTPKIYIPTAADKAALESLYEKIALSAFPGEVVQGTIVDMKGRYVVVDIGDKADGIVPSTEFRDQADLEVGSTVEVYVEQREDKQGRLRISRKKAKQVQGWKKIIVAFEEQVPVEGLVTRKVKGGLTVDVHGVETFLPGSQVDRRPVFDFDVYVGKQIELVVLKIKTDKRGGEGNVIVSHRKLIEKDLEEQRKDIINNLEKGQILEGMVKNITNFGVFVDLGGVDGLLHVTDISWSKVEEPKAIFKHGEAVRVVVTDFDENRKRISLGMKQLEAHPWDSLPEDVQVGSKVKGKVTKVTDYGAFLELQKGVEGLMHLSEMSWSQNPRNPKDYVQLGETYDVVVLSIDREEKKMSLGLKQLTPMPWEEARIRATYPMGSRHKGAVRSVTNFGVFVELEPGLEGLVHVSDLSWVKKITNPVEVIKPGEPTEVVVLDVDVEARKMSLGIKQLEEDPWDTFAEVLQVGSVHQAIIRKKTQKGALVELPYGVEGYVAKKDLVKEDKTDVQIEETLPFKVLELNRSECRVVVSHIATYLEEASSSSETGSGTKHKTAPKRTASPAAKSTLGELEALSGLKAKMDAAAEIQEAENKAAVKKTKAASKPEEEAEEAIGNKSKA